eukprot:gene3805-4386_t
MRDFIQDSLYNPKYGYFTSKEVINSIDPKQFRDPMAFKNRKEYQIYLRDLYKETQHSWFTPVEIFQKHEKREDKTKPLKIYEVGAGSGTNAMCILNHLKEHHADVYKSTQYTIVEISRLLAVKQLDRIKQAHPDISVRVFNTSIFNWTHAKEEDECFVVLTEVIDNLPHDKIVINQSGIFETSVITPVGSLDTHIEDFHRVQDPLILEYLELNGTYGDGMLAPSNSMGIKHIYSSIRNFFDGDRTVFLPTVCLRLFQMLAYFFPRHHIVLADFDFIPSLVAGENAPTVQEKVSEVDPDTKQHSFESIDRRWVTVPLGSCDIFFPTNWADLHSMYVKTNQNRPGFELGQVRSLKQTDFLKIYTKEDIAGSNKRPPAFNPMTQDYTNMSFLVS